MWLLCFLLKLKSGNDININNLLNVDAFIKNGGKGVEQYGFIYNINQEMWYYCQRYNSSQETKCHRN